MLAITQCRNFLLYMETFPRDAQWLVDVGVIGMLINKYDNKSTDIIGHINTWETESKTVSRKLIAQMACGDLKRNKMVS